jgi:hypothetical protein
MNLDQELVRQAADVLGTRGATETVHRALAEVVRGERLSRLAGRTFRSLSGRRLESFRRTRVERNANA